MNFINTTICLNQLVKTVLQSGLSDLGNSFETKIKSIKFFLLFSEALHSFTKLRKYTDGCFYMIPLSKDVQTVLGIVSQN